MRDVGDSDVQRETVRRPTTEHGIVEIARVLTIDRDKRQVAQITAAFDRIGGHFCGDPREFRGYFGRPFNRKIVSPDRDVDLHARRHVVTENFDDFAHCLSPMVGLFGDFRHDELPVLDLLAGFGNQDILVDPAIVRCHEADPAFTVVASHNLFVCTFENLNDVAIRSIAFVIAADAYEYTIPVQHTVGFTMGQEYVGVAIVGPDECEAIGMAEDPTGDQLHAFRDAVAIAARVEQFPVAGHRLQTTSETDDPGFFYNLECCRDIAERQRRRCCVEERRDVLAAGNGHFVFTLSGRGFFRRASPLFDFLLIH